jgi:aryl-alcohol dehydrogenase-like predicted oxidoreductase
MEHTRLGNTGLKISRLALGCMSYGNPDTPGAHRWALNDDDSQPFFQQAVELGITFWDTANTYQAGTSEEVVGRAVKRYSRREDIVLATKVWGKMHDGPGGHGLSRRAILEQIDASLTRLGTDYVDLYQIHRLDLTTPIEETLEALHDVVKAGKARYIGASSMYAWQFAQALYLAGAHGWTRFASMQNHYNLLYREEEREMLPLCADQGVAVIPWSPLARGNLTRDWRSETSRSQTDEFGKTLYAGAEEADHATIDAVAAVAERRGVPRAQVALAWVAANPAVTAPIVGATKPHHLTDAMAAVSLTLDADEVRLLEEHYRPRPVAGF